MILEEFDETKRAVINPDDIIKPVEGMPKTAVTCFAKDTFQRMLENFSSRKTAETLVANMEIPVYKITYKGVELALFMSDVGAPACVAVLEDVFAMGAERIIIFGTCGVLDAAIEDCSIIIPDAAVRDEGTSFHYAPPSDEIKVNTKYMKAFQEMLDDIGCSYTVGKTWTTDGIYRETRQKVAKRKEMGCVCVDMECSAAAALASFRGKDIFQFFYAADNLDSEVWDIRSLANKTNLTEKDKAALLAMDFAVQIEKNDN